MTGVVASVKRTGKSPGKSPGKKRNSGAQWTVLLRNLSIARNARKASTADDEAWEKEIMGLESRDGGQFSLLTRSSKLTRVNYRIQANKFILAGNMFPLSNGTLENRGM